VSGTNLAQIYCIAGALLGFWAYARFPSIAPTKISSAMLVLLAAVAALSPASQILGWSIGQAGEAGALLGLFGAVLPALTALFWATACVFRVFCGLLGPGIR
jgi:uncharacterized BrkB/YihY/UPF0761 family membrane protein